MTKPKTRSIFIIRLVIEGDPNDASEVVDKILDVGVLQDAINDHDYDAGPLTVISATGEV